MPLNQSSTNISSLLKTTPQISLILHQFNFNTKRHFEISFPRENEGIKHDLVEFKVQCLKVFCYHRHKSTILLFYSILELLKFPANFTLLNEIC